MLAILIVLPLLIAALLSLVPYEQQKTIKYIAFAASIATLLAAIYLFVNPPGTQSVPWFGFNGIPINITTATAPMNLLLMMVVAVITPLIFLYSMGFMELPSEQSRFYFEMCIFAAAMLLFSISASFITMFIAWEMLGITSYLLIGFWYKREKAPTAARKAITTILIGDIAMLVAILLIGVSYGSFDFSTVLQAPVASVYLKPALLLILIGAFTKSAQFPFHEWLADAMEGPTPVSAFLHSSTMVKAGVFLVAVLLPLYAKANMLPIILIFGMISALVGVSNALTERHIKKILAYSTIEDLGLMFVALGLNALVAAMMLFFFQAFYKALAFMGAGVVMRANSEKEDLYEVHGSASDKILFSAALVSVLSIAAIFPISGFFGKAMVESAAFSSNLMVYGLLLLIGFGTSVYIFRWLIIPARAPSASNGNGSLAIMYKSTPIWMRMAMIILAILAVVVSYLYLYLPGFISQQTLQYTPISLSGALIGMAVSVAGIVVAYYIYRLGNRVYVSSTNPLLYKIAYNSVLVNAAYMWATRAFMSAAAVIGWMDIASDRSTYLISNMVIRTGHVGKRLVNGQVNLYVLAFVAGLLAILLIFWL